MRKITRPLLGTGLCLAFVAGAAFADSHAAEIDKAVKARHAQMQLIAYHTGLLGAIAKGEAEYDSATVDAAAANLRELAKLERGPLWVEGTEQTAVPGSRAKLAIWQDSDGFAAKFIDLENAAGGMIGAGDAQEVGARMGAIGNACKDCHDSYRGPKN